MTDTVSSTGIDRRLVRWGLYPASWAFVLFGFHRILAWGEEARSVWLQTSAVLFLVYLVIEVMLPYQRRWAMRWKSCGRICAMWR